MENKPNKITFNKKHFENSVREGVRKVLSDKRFKEFDRKHIVTENQENEELHNVIHKSGNKWKIRGHHGDWDATYDSKEDAEKGLRAYFANKSESIKLTQDDLNEIVEKIVSKLSK